MPKQDKDDADEETYGATMVVALETSYSAWQFERGEDEDVEYLARRDAEGIIQELESRNIVDSGEVEEVRVETDG